MTKSNTITKEMNNQPNVEETKEVFDLLNDQYIETPFHIIESYFKGQHLERLVKHQLESYNNFVNFQITKTIEMFNPVHIASEQDFDPNIKKHSLELFVTFENFNIYRPQIYENNGAIKLMFPQEARLRNFTYASAMTVDINIKYVVRTGPNLENVETFYKTLHKIHIGKLPIMLKSNICVLTQYKHVDHNQTGECRFDAGGYFIINGSEKTVLGQERAAENKVFCFNISKNNTKYHWLAEIKSVPDFKCISPKQINMMISSKNNGFGNVIHIQIPRVKQPLPLFIVFRALGAITDKEICEKILLDIENKQKKELLQALQASIMEADKYLTQEDAIKHITSYVMYTPINMDKETGAKKKLEFTMDILKNDLFPHCHNVTEKIYFLGYMANKLLQTSFQIFKTDDRDSYANKRIDLTGTLLNNLFRNYFNKLVKDMEKQVIREINTGSWKSKDDYENILNQTNIYKIIKSTTIENGIKRALATGDFGIKNTNSNKVGVAQVLNRLTYVSSLSHARRISTPTDKSGKLIPPRKLHNTSWGFVCVTGDTDVLLSNRMDTKKIKEIRDGDWVNTVNRESLMDEPSDMYQSFSKMPDKLFELVTISGRKIKATADHPFLVKKPDGTYQMKKVGELNVKEDKVMIRHTISPIPIKTVNTETVILKEETVQLAKYRIELLEHNLLNTEIPTGKLKIIARLLGALNTDGHLSIKNDSLFGASFNLGEEYDVYQVADDIKTLGFGNVSIRRKISKFEDKNKNKTTTTCTWEVCKSGVFAYFMYLMGAIPGKKTETKRVIPEWLVNADLSVKREFLSAFQGGDGSRLSYQKNDKTFKPNLGITMQTTDNNYLNETIEYMNQISKMFHELNILCTVKTKEIVQVQIQRKTIIYLVFEKSTENLLRYAETISYTYCEEKRRVSAPIIEHLKIRGFNKLQRDTKYTYIFDNYTKEPIESLIEKTALSENQIRKVISKMKKEGKNMVNTRLTTDTIYEDFIRENIADNGCISIGLLSITEIEPELVYDFTTRSENHSFVASSFVVSNCPAETPEGQSVGIVKNLSYMTHITIYSNSLPLYEYILPNVKTFEQSTKEELFTNVKVFINGAWVGVTEKPEELYLELKEKKYKGIINVYTSIIFDYRLKEIRVCNDGGRLSRPVLRIKDKNLLITSSIIKKLQSSELVWDDLFTNARIEESVLEYIDPEEQNLSMIATVPKDIIRKTESDSIYKYTHCEIHPSTIFGVLASCIPFPENNQSPRNCYQCLDINETVLLSNGSKIPIKNIKIGDKVICFNPETMEISHTKVVNHYVRETEKKIYKICTLSGREIVATEDHKFMTIEGWCETKNMVINETKIGILPNQSIPLENINAEKKLILDEESFREFFIMNNFGDRIINKYITELKNIGLLPLYNTNENLPILSRIFGFLLADGSINIYERNGNKFSACSFDFGTENDVKNFENDLLLCGFNKCKFNKASRTLNETIHTTYAVTHNGILPALLLSLGVSFGKKTESYRKEIPNWIINGNKLIKREFLSGFQGGDGCKIRWNKMSVGYNFICAETSQQINPKYLNSLIKFMEQCVEILKDFDIEVSNMKNNKVEENRIKVSFKISDKHSNLIKYYENIGYRYASTKNINSFVIIEYLKYKEYLFELHKKHIEKIRNLYDENKSNTLIANELKIPVNYVSDVVKSYKNNRKISMKNLGDNTIENWIEEVKIINDMLFIPIKSLEIVENCLISDITVESENHSFIAGNNFLSSNCAQGKQAMGVYVTNYENRMDKTAYVLNYPTRPLVDTRIMNMIQLNKIPSGTNVIVAIMTHTGYNQEDSLLFNKASVDRGLFVTTVYHTEKDEDKQKINGDEEIRCKPDPLKTKGMKMANYQKVNSKGVIPENTLVANRDIIISKVIPIKENRNDHTKVIKFEDQSKLYRTTEETYIDKNYIDKNGDGYNFAKVRLRTVRKPVIGDKFSSRHGQKGTIGNIIPECDMPFTSTGLKPDIIINPHAIPSRMTIGQLKETLLGKVLVELGLFGDGTSFGKLDINDIRKELLKIGYESNGNELLHNGLTGEQVECSVFMGPVFYQRLKHMVVDKAHSRSIGPMVNLTRQPAEGRSRDGGLRFGEMERDCENENTPISTTNGLSVLIKNMENCEHEVLGWNEKEDILVPAKQSGFLYKGEKECIQLTMEDGRINICTPDHPLLTSDKKWIKAKDLIVNSDRIKTGITCPVVDFKEEMEECNGWKVQVGELLFKTDNYSEYKKTLFLAKLIGYLITDGNIYKNDNNKKNKLSCCIYFGHMIDVRNFVADLKLLCNIKQQNFKCRNLYHVKIPNSLTRNIIQLSGIIINKRVNQPAQLPAFILDPSCPRPIIREFLGGIFGGDGHTCVLGMHRGKRDLLSSISFSQTKKQEHLESLTEMFTNLQKLLKKCGIEKTTIQKFKETTSSKKTQTELNNKSYQLTLHLDIEELVSFSEKIGFRYCCHKSQRLEAGVSYKRLRNEVKRQHDWLTNRVNEITHFMDSKKENPLKIVPTKKALEQAIKELKEKEALVHEYAIPSTHDITDHLIKGTTFGKFTSKSFPTAEEYLREIGALDWFLQDLDYKKNIKDLELDLELEQVEDKDFEEIEENDTNSSRYGVERVKEGLPTMELKVIDIRPAGMHKVYDIQVDEVHSFLANGLVAHNCMISHGASRFTRERMYDVSDKYNVHVCKKCGSIASYNDTMNIHHCKICDNRVDFAYVEIPYACKLLFQELNTMNIAPRIMTKQD